MTDQQHAVDQHARAGRDIDKRVASDDDFLDLSKMTKQEIAAELVRRHQAYHAEVDGKGLTPKADGGQRSHLSSAPSIAAGPLLPQDAEPAPGRHFGDTAKFASAVRQDPDVRQDAIGRSEGHLRKPEMPSTISRSMPSTTMPSPARPPNPAEPKVRTAAVTLDDLRVPEDDIRPISAPAATSRPARQKTTMASGPAFLWGVFSGALLLGLGLVGAWAIYVNPSLSIRWPQIHTLVQSLTASVAREPISAPNGSVATQRNEAPAISPPDDPVSARQAPQAGSAQPLPPSVVVPAASNPLPQAPAPSARSVAGAAPATVTPSPEPAAPNTQSDTQASKSTGSKLPVARLKSIQVETVPVKPVHRKSTTGQPSKAWLTPQPFAPSETDGMPSARKSGNAWLTPQPFNPDLAPQ